MAYLIKYHKIIKLRYNYLCSFLILYESFRSDRFLSLSWVLNIFPLLSVFKLCTCGCLVFFYKLSNFHVSTKIYFNYIDKIYQRKSWLTCYYPINREQYSTSVCVGKIINYCGIRPANYKYDVCHKK